MNEQIEHIPTVPGTPFGGGHYVGLISIAGAVMALIAAPKVDGETTGAWMGAESECEEDDDDDGEASAVDVAGARSCFDGRANTAAMAEAGSELAKWARGLAIGGHTDWHIPSRDELELLYRHLKPTARNNYVWRNGDNPSSVPTGYPYTAAEPAQTAVEAFKAGAAEAFEAEWYWSSTQCSDGHAWLQHFYAGFQSSTTRASRPAAEPSAGFSSALDPLVL